MENKTENKVFVVCFDWLAKGGENDNEIIGVFTKKEDAVECMNDHIENERKEVEWINKPDTIIENYTESENPWWAAYPDGRYLEQYEAIKVVEKTIQECYTPDEVKLNNWFSNLSFGDKMNIKLNYQKR